MLGNRFSSALNRSNGRWDEHATSVDAEHGANNSIIAVRAVRVGDYGGCSIGTTRGSVLTIDPDMPEAESLKTWFQGRGNASFEHMSKGGGGGAGGPAPRKFVADIEKESLGSGAKPDIFSLTCYTTMFFTEKNWQYPSNPENKKKVVEDGDGWRDESTGSFIKDCQRRYIVPVSFSDSTGRHIMTAFDDQAKSLLGVSADELYEMSNSDEAEAKNVWKKATFKPCVLKVRAKKETYNDEERVKCAIMDLQPLNFVSESKALLDRIQRYRLE